MADRVKTVILICSLVFNVTFVSLFIYRRAIVEKEAQPQEYERYHGNKERGKSLQIREQRREFVEMKREFFAELSKPEINEAELKLFLDRLIEKQTEMEKSIGQNLIEMRKNMTSEEAEQFFEEMSRRRNPHPHPHQRRR